jgi:hypothetical protein
MSLPTFGEKSRETTNFALFEPVPDDWLIAPCSHGRDSDCADESNWSSQEAELHQAGAPEDYEILRFGHWACGWYEIVIVRPGSPAAAKAEELAARLENYPLLDEDDFSQREHEEAEQVWTDCYNEKERIAYIRENEEQFKFRGFADMLGCVRGKYFGGYASELICR